MKKCFSAAQVIVVVVLLVLTNVRETAGAAGGNTLRWDDRSGVVSADLLDAPVRGVLEQIHLATGWDIQIEPGVAFPVSTTFNELKPARALERLLGRANYAVISRTNAPPRLLVFETTMDRATERLLGEQGLSRAVRIDDEWLVFLKPGEDAGALAQRVGARITGRIPELNAVRLKFEDAEAAKEARAVLEADPAVDSLHENYEMNRPAEGRPLQLGGGNLPRLIPGDATGDGQLVVAFVDTAVQVPDGELSKFFLPAIQLAGAHEPPPQPATHGTIMVDAAMQAMATTLGEGSVANVRFLNVDIFGPGEDTSLFLLAQGMISASNAGADIINVSGGAAAQSGFLDTIAQSIYAQGRMIIAAAGNVPDGVPIAPSSSPTVLSVTSVDRNGQLSEWANMNATVDVGMPGRVVSTLSGVATYSAGTSVSTALATGAVAGLSLQTGVPVQDAGMALQQVNPAPQGIVLQPR